LTKNKFLFLEAPIATGFHGQLILNIQLPVKETKSIKSKSNHFLQTVKHREEADVGGKNYATLQKTYVLADVSAVCLY